MKISLQDISETTFIDTQTKNMLVKEVGQSELIIPNTLKKYLIDLLNLKYSVVNDKIDDNQRNYLSDLDTYKKVAIYNIKAKAFNILDNYKDKIFIIDNKIDDLSAYLNCDGNIKLLYSFNYNYKNSGINPLIGNITINKIISNAYKIKQMEDTLKYLKANLYYDRHVGHNVWEHNSNKVIELEREIKKLRDEDSNVNLNYQNVVLNNEIFDLFIKDYQLDISNLNDAKTLTKKLPNLNIETNIKTK